MTQPLTIVYSLISKSIKIIIFLHYKIFPSFCCSPTAWVWPHYTPLESFQLEERKNSLSLWAFSTSISCLIKGEENIKVRGYLWEESGETCSQITRCGDSSCSYLWRIKRPLRDAFARAGLCMNEHLRLHFICARECNFILMTPRRLKSNWDSLEREGSPHDRLRALNLHSYHSFIICCRAQPPPGLSSDRLATKAGFQFPTLSEKAISPVWHTLLSFLFISEGIRRKRPFIYLTCVCASSEAVKMVPA